MRDGLKVDGSSTFGTKQKCEAHAFLSGKGRIREAVKSATVVVATQHLNLDNHAHRAQYLDKLELRCCITSSILQQRHKQDPQTQKVP